ncbi:CPBP family intramembrane glutamic endopeptidase [Sphingomonas lenta]|uniref:CPBP family intramembrane metalloprotease n=1 Tax=Sphingomonas lenta TaxID=1141887 RepID=A0A2A2SDF5_9SPHN|nr:CPBP family intramembrane glutamic endopeptidase [Sphingomonas lenta]PAX07230.1 CPBP family intramembrane metalloprotease [Sphingomonas lenta]
MLAAALLAAALIQLGLRVAGRSSLAAQLLPMRGRAPFAVWAGRLWLSFAIPALAALLLIGRDEALSSLPAELAPAAALARSYGRFEAWPILLGLALGSVLAAGLSWWRQRRGRRAFYLGRPPRLPSSARELPAAALLAVSAGVTEELYFRLMLPLLIALVTGSALLGVGISALLFGAAHRYQGWVGVVATGLVGLFLSVVHLASGDLWLAMACHATIDLNALVVRPALGFQRQR